MVKLITPGKKVNSGVEIYFIWRKKVQVRHHRKLLTPTIPAQLVNLQVRVEETLLKSEMNSKVEMLLYLDFLPN